MGRSFPSTFHCPKVEVNEREGHMQEAELFCEETLIVGMGNAGEPAREPGPMGVSVKFTYWLIVHIGLSTFSVQGAVLGARDGVVSKLKVPVPAEAFIIVNGDNSHRNN